MQAYSIKFSNGRHDDASSLEEAVDLVRDNHPGALFGENLFFVPFGDAMSTVATLTVVVEMDPNAN